jgi:UDP-N-acetylmuramoyl-L-alanyl-D-glutamate--2,6-diaminopimelate ligase
MSPTSTSAVALHEIFPSASPTAARVMVSGCASDWRQVQPGDAFVAILGDDQDGHDHVRQAVERGAAAVVVERPVPVFNVPVHEVEDTRVALGELCHALAGHPSRQLRVIGVIGAQGKSTVAALLESIYDAAGCDVGVLSSLKSYDGMANGPGIGDGLSPVALAERLARMDAAGCTHAIVEISSRALSQCKLAGMELDSIVATAIGTANVHWHHSPQNYRDAQRRALDLLSPAGLAVLDGEDAVACQWLSTLDAPTLTYGFDDEAQITAEIVERNACETVFILSAGCESAAVRTTIVGDHHVRNCLAAATTALAHGIDLQTIAAGIEAVQQLSARMERVDCGQDYALFVDAAANATALRATLRTARRLARGRVICVLGDSFACDAIEAATVRSVVRKLADLTIVTDALTDFDPDWRTASDDASALQVAADRGEAIAWAIATAGEGDVVVIAGSRAQTQCQFGSTEMSDADAVREVLYSCAQLALKIAG